jgi:pimeloyl-ACP methyl ester carboxylesterase
MNGSRTLALVATVVATVMPAVGTSTAGSSDYPSVLAAYADQEFEWHECLPGEGVPFFECAFVVAPLDWFHPDRGEIRLAISRVEATDPARRRGIALSNPGGPGGSGLRLPLLAALFIPDLAAVYDSIGMDIRGVGGSTRLDCVTSEQFLQGFAIDGRDLSAASVKAQAALDRSIADSCSSAPLTPYITSEQMVRDMDLLRALFDEPRVSYVGYSAGTWLGAAYASTYPDRVDRFVLDSTVEFTGTWHDVFANQPPAFQRRFEVDFLPWIARHDDLYRFGSTSAQANATYEARRAKLSSTPLDLGNDVVLTPTLYDNAVLFALYAAAKFPDAAAGLAAIEHWSEATDQERTATRSFFSRPLGLQTVSSVATAVTCNDTAWSTDFGDYVHEATKVGRRYPLLGYGATAFACPFWGHPFGRSPIDAREIPPLLMINSEHDPATPLRGALAAHREVKGSVLLTVLDDGDHQVFGFAGNPCVDRIAIGWLVDGILPDHDLSCPGLPLPVPSPPAAAHGPQT